VLRHGSGDGAIRDVMPAKFWLRAMAAKSCQCRAYRSPWWRLDKKLNGLAQAFGRL